MTLISQFATCIISLSFYKIYSLEYLPCPNVWIQNSIFKLTVSKSLDAIKIADIAVSCKSFFCKFLVFE